MFRIYHKSLPTFPSLLGKQHEIKKEKKNVYTMALSFILPKIKDQFIELEFYTILFGNNDQGGKP